MTAGYDPRDPEAGAYPPAPRQPADEPTAATPADSGASQAGRPGPLPPRLDPPRTYGSVPVPPTSAPPTSSAGAGSAPWGSGTEGPTAADASAGPAGPGGGHHVPRQPERAPDTGGFDAGRGGASPWSARPPTGSHPVVGARPPAGPAPAAGNPAGRGYAPGDAGRPGQAPPTGEAPRYPQASGTPSNSTWPASSPSYPAPASQPPAQPAAGHAASPTYPPTFAPSGPGGGYGAPSSGSPGGGHGAVPGSSGGGYASPATGMPEWPGVGAAPAYGTSGPPHATTPFPSEAGPARIRRRLAWPGVLALVMVVALVAVAVLQAVQINRLNQRLTAADRRSAQTEAAAQGRIGALEDQTSQLAAQAGKVFNPEAIATAVLPSVFRVKAGNSLGTAFAVGKPATGGGTNLYTNFHVVESVWKAGGKEVELERQSDTFTAAIIEVDEDNDVAHLQVSEKFAGLVIAEKPVKSGQQIVVVGSPLGLSDSVTTGVVSAFRKQPDGSGTVIQFDAPINPGNSGGPVINGEKKVVGIATAKARDAEGIGLALPISTACESIPVCK